jgi:hypothetical protein
MHHKTGSAPDFTNACIVMFSVNIAWVFFVLWAVWGLIAVAATGWCINLCISRLAARRA